MTIENKEKVFSEKKKTAKIGSNRPGRIMEEGRTWRTPKRGGNEEIENYKRSKFILVHQDLSNSYGYIIYISARVSYVNNTELVTLTSGGISSFWMVDLNWS